VDAPLVRSSLVLHHSRFTAEALQAAFMSTLVWTLPSVNSSVAGKTRRLAQSHYDRPSGLMGSSTYVRKSLAAADMLTLMGLFAGVRADVDRQRAALDEALSTSWRSTGVRPLVCVDAIMPLQV
jgi:hypothetical protein